MKQRDRDRLIALKKAGKGLVTQKQAAEEIGQSERHVCRLLAKLKSEGDAGIVHGMLREAGLEMSPDPEIDAQFRELA